MNSRARRKPDGNVSDRPTGISIGADGVIYVADDFAGVVYRLTNR